jgi:iron complex outermembrane receptor protein
MKLVRTWTACVAATLTFLMAPAGAAGAAGAAEPGRVMLSIEAQPIRDALRALSEQTGLQILFRSEGVNAAGLTAPRVSGELSAREALDRLLAESGLKYEFVNERTVRISSAAPVAMDVSEGVAPAAGTESAEDLRLAQVESTPQTDAAAQATSTPDSSERGPAMLEEVVVTGSRVERTAFDMPTPVVTLGREQIRQSGFTGIVDLLTQLPSVGLGPSLSTSQFEDDAGATFANLRSLGSARTLVLINGRRRVAGSSDSSAVDLSSIPAPLIERVELITGGASAVYGADAVSGVINVILKDDFAGLEVSGQGGFSQHGGAENFAATLAGGNAFADGRGRFSFGASHVREEPLFSRDRSFTSSWISLDVNPDNTGGADGIPDLITVRDFSIPLFHPGGAFFLSDGMYTVDPGLRPIGAGDGWDFSGYFQQRMQADTTAVRGNLSYELTDDVELFVESDFSHGTAYSGGAPNYDFGIPLQRDNPFIPADLGARMDGEGLSELTVYRANVDQGLRDDDNSRNALSILSGLQGRFGDGWKWQAFAQYGRYELTSRETNQRITSRFFEAIDVISDPLSGDPVCRSEAARAAGCRPLDILGQNAASDDAFAYYRVDRTLRVDNTQTLAGAQLTGNLLDLPAGPLASAMGLEYRKDTRTYKDDPLAELGLLSDKAAGTSLTGEDAVSEAFLELVAPLLRDKPFAKYLEVEGAVRLSDYDSIGSETAWKLGGSWSPVAGVRLRTTVSQSVRAPSLYELFSPRQVSLLNMFDPCEISQIGNNDNRAANCRALGVPEGWEGPAGPGQLAIFNTVGGGNPALDPETSDAWTVGLVFAPQSVAGLSVAVDYWNIEIDAAVQPLDPSTIVQRCVDSSSIENVFCPRVTRGPDSAISLVDSSIINVGQLSTDGIDIQAAYVFRPDEIGIGLPGRVSVAVNASYLLSLEELIDAGDPSSLLLSEGAYNTPTWRGTLSLGYTNQALRVNLNSRLIGRARVDMNSSLETYDKPSVGAKIYHDLALGYAIGERYDLRLSVNNLLDTEPPMTAFTYLGGNSSLYDSLGRYFVLGASARF